MTWWRHQMETFSALLAICAVPPFVRSPVNSPHKGQWCGALMFSLICVWINDWVNNGEAGDLRRYLTHCDVTVMNSRYFLYARSSWHRNIQDLMADCDITIIITEVVTVTPTDEMIPIIHLKCTIEGLYLFNHHTFNSKSSDRNTAVILLYVITEDIVEIESDASIKFADICLHSFSFYLKHESQECFM